MVVVDEGHGPANPCLVEHALQAEPARCGHAGAGLRAVQVGQVVGAVQDGVDHLGGGQGRVGRPGQGSGACHQRRGVGASRSRVVVVGGVDVGRVEISPGSRQVHHRGAVVGAAVQAVRIVRIGHDYRICTAVVGWVERRAVQVIAIVGGSDDGDDPCSIGILQRSFEIGAVAGAREGEVQDVGTVVDGVVDGLHGLRARGGTGRVRVLLQVHDRDIPVDAGQPHAVVPLRAGQARDEGSMVGLAGTPAGGLCRQSGGIRIGVGIAHVPAVAVVHVAIAVVVHPVAAVLGGVLPHLGREVLVIRVYPRIDDRDDQGAAARGHVPGVERADVRPRAACAAVDGLAVVVVVPLVGGEVVGRRTGLFVEAGLHPADAVHALPYLDDLAHGRRSGTVEQVQGPPPHLATKHATARGSASPQCLRILVYGFSTYAQLPRDELATRLDVLLKDAERCRPIGKSGRSLRHIDVPEDRTESKNGGETSKTVHHDNLRVRERDCRSPVPRPSRFTLGSSGGKIPLGKERRLRNKSCPTMQTNGRKTKYLFSVSPPVGQQPPPIPWPSSGWEPSASHGTGSRSLGATWRSTRARSP